jgi:hypothetical protein
MEWIIDHNFLPLLYDCVNNTRKPEDSLLTYNKYFLHLKDPHCTLKSNKWFHIVGIFSLSLFCVSDSVFPFYFRSLFWLWDNLLLWILGWDSFGWWILCVSLFVPNISLTSKTFSWFNWPTCKVLYCNVNWATLGNWELQINKTRKEVCSLLLKFSADT